LQEKFVTPGLILAPPPPSFVLNFSFLFMKIHLPCLLPCSSVQDVGEKKKKVGKMGEGWPVLSI